jgi:predicted Rossmann fold flavoprotein
MELDPNQKFDVVIIGGGAAGIMAAISAKKNNSQARVVIIDQSFELGRKILVAGSGRANVTNVNLAQGPQNYYYGENKLVYSVFTQFGYQQICDFLKNLGIPLYEETKTNRGKIFPVIENAKTVRDILVEELISLGVEIILNTPVVELKSEAENWIVITKKKSLVANKVILTCGGRTYPALGSDGSGYTIAKKLGHRIVTPVPSAVPLVSKNQLSHLLQGEKMVMEATAFITGIPRAKSIGDVMFTQYGLSGPAILDISRDISIRINREGIRDTMVKLSFFPNITPEQIKIELKARWVKHPNYLIDHSLWGLLTQKAAAAVCAAAKLSKELTVNLMAPDEINRLIEILTGFEASIIDTRGWNEAEFTAGGVDLSEINAANLSSKIAPNIYFAGEIMDVDGTVGGYNLSWAWATGWIAGKTS